MTEQPAQRPPSSLSRFSSEKATMASSTAEQASIEAEQEGKVRSKGQTIILMTALCLAIFLASLDTVIITTALPTIATVFEISDSGYAWIGSAYLLTNAAFVPFWGKISDVFGRKPILIIANVIFMAGSIISALSKSMSMLIAGRAVQGLGGGGIVILVNICVSDLFSLRSRGLMFGIVGAVWAVSSALGPVLGGIFTQKLSWRWSFWINLPMDSIALLIIFFFLDIHTPQVPLIVGLRTIDWIGAVTMAGATIMTLLGLQLGGIAYAWNSPTVVCLLVFGILTFVLFFTSQFKFSPDPIMPFRIFSDVSNLSALAVCFFDAFVFNSVAYFLPLYFQTVLSASPLDSGIWMLALAIPLAIFSASAGWIMEKTGRYLELLRGGLVLMTLGVGLFINFQAYISWPRIIIFLIIVGIGFGPNFHAPLIALQTRLAPKDVASGTATFGFIRMISGAIGVVLGQVVFQGQMQMHLKRLDRTGLPGEILTSLASGSAISTTTKPTNFTTAQNLIIRDAKAQSFSQMWILYTVISFLGLLASLGIGKNALSTTHEEYKPGLGLSSATESDSEEKEKGAHTTQREVV